MSAIEALPIKDRIDYYRERAKQKAASAQTLQASENQIELLIANAWQRLADYLDAGARKSPSSQQDV